MPKGLLKPNSEAQAFFLSLPNSIFEAVCGGEAGGGKTESLLSYPIHKGWYKHPKFKGILFRETYPELEKSLIPRALEMYEPLGGKWNGQDHCFDFRRSIGGGKIWLSYIRSLKDARKHDTNEYNYVGWDEITHFEQRPYRYILHRIRSSTPELPAVARAGATPGGVGNLWVYKRFIKPHRAGRRVLMELQPKTGKYTKRIFVPIKLEDNIDMAIADPDYDTRIDLLPEAERKAKRGDWLAFIGTVFSEFRTARFAEDQNENALHVIPAFKIPDYWPRILAIDWGFSDGSTCCLWGAISPDGVLYVYREFLVKYAYITEWAAEIKRLSVGEKIHYAVIDPSAAKNMGQPKTILQQAQEALGIPLDRADNDRLGGKMLLHELFRWKPKPVTKLPSDFQYDAQEEEYIYRNFGEKARTDYLQQFLPEEPEKNLPKCRIFDSCPQTIEAIQMCTYDTEGKNPEDVMEFSGDDPYDDIRYLSKAYERYIQVAVKEQAIAKRLDEIHAQFQTTGDMGSFMRKMEHFEREHSRNSGPVRRNRGFRHPVRAQSRY